MYFVETSEKAKELLEKIQESPFKSVIVTMDKSGIKRKKKNSTIIMAKNMNAQRCPACGTSKVTYRKILAKMPKIKFF